MFAFIFFLMTFINPDLETIRDLYAKSVYSEKTTKILIEKADGFDNKPLATAYKAAGLALMAKHKFSPWDKMSYLKKASELFEEAVKSDLNNVEVRFLRLSIEVNTPSFVGMSKNVQTDSQAIIRNYKNFASKSGNKDMSIAIKDMLLKNKLCSPNDLSLD
jgi:hypothetical protein